MNDLDFIRHTTKVKTRNGKVYDLGKGQYPPADKDPKHPNPDNLVVNAWTEPSSDQ